MREFAIVSESYLRENIANATEQVELNAVQGDSHLKCGCLLWRLFIQSYSTVHLPQIRFR